MIDTVGPGWCAPTASCTGRAPAQLSRPPPPASLLWLPCMARRTSLAARPVPHRDSAAEQHRYGAYSARGERLQHELRRLQNRAQRSPRAAQRSSRRRRGRGGGGGGGQAAQHRARDFRVAGCGPGCRPPPHHLDEVAVTLRFHQQLQQVRLHAGSQLHPQVLRQGPHVTSAGGCCGQAAATWALRV